MSTQTGHPPANANRHGLGAGYYGPALFGPSSIGALAEGQQARAAVQDVLRRLEPDDYGRYLTEFLRAGEAACGASWRYADICTACWAAARLIRPGRYLEIGVRRGRSMAMVAAAAPQCELLGFDLWLAGYAGMENPGKELVLRELAKLGHQGGAAFIDGDSHATLKAYFAAHPTASFDLVTVDGDHGEAGAAEDLEDVLPHVAVGGAVVFDDIAHPKHLYLAEVWRRALAGRPNFRDWRFDELGFGVALAVRME